MNTLPSSKIAKLLFTFLLVMSTTACPDPQKAADQIFNDEGLNRLRKPNDYMQVGSIIIVKDKKAIYADNMTDYVPADTNTTVAVPLVSGRAVIKSYQNETAMTAETALNFLDSFMPVKASGKLALSTNVKMDMINANVKRMKIPDMRNFLSDDTSAAFRAAVMRYLQKGNKVFIAYETYTTNKFKLTADGGKDISVGATVGEIKPIFSGAEPKFTYKKTSKSEIVINGDTYYVFALRTGELVMDQQTRTLDFVETKFAPKGVLAAGTDVRFSSALVGDKPLDFKPVEIVRETRVEDQP